MNNKSVGYKIKNNNSSLGVEVLDFEYGHIFDKTKLEDLRNLWLKFSIIIFNNLKLTHHQLEKFSLAFGVFGDDPYIDSIEGHKNIIEVKREANEKPLLLVALGILIGPFRSVLRQQRYFIQK